MPKAQLKLLPGKRDADATPPTAPFPPLVATPSPPKWLTDEEALKEWARLAPALVGARRLHAGNVMALAHLCAIHARIAEEVRLGKEPDRSLLSTYRAYAKPLDLFAKAR